MTCTACGGTVVEDEAHLCPADARDGLILSLRQLVEDLRERVTVLEARDMNDAITIARELDRLEHARQQTPAEQARRFDREVRERAALERGG